MSRSMKPGPAEGTPQGQGGTIRAASPEVPYAQIARALLQDEALAIEVRGMLAYVLSLPPDWRLRLYGPRGKGRLAASLQAACGCGRNRLQRMVRVATEAGYITRVPRRDEATGRLCGQGYMVHHEPVCGAGHRVPENPSHGREGTQSIEESLHREIPPSPPEPPGPALAPAASRGRGRGKVIETIQGEGQPVHAVAMLTAWLDQGLRWPDVPSPLDWARQVCSDTAAERAEALLLVAAELGALQTHRMPPAADILTAVAAARKGHSIREAIHAEAVRQGLTRRARQTSEAA